MPKLYDVPEGSRLKLPISDDKETWVDDNCKFFHIDGMYSYIETSDGKPVHLYGGTEMVLKDGYYEMEKDDTNS